MNIKPPGIHPPSTTVPPTRAKLSFVQKLIEPAAAITGESERRQASLVSALLLVLTLTMVSGVVYMGFYSTSPVVAYVLIVSDIIIGFSYVLSRTRHNRLAALVGLIVLAVIPILNVVLVTDHSPTALLVLFIWNILTILLSSAIASTRTTFQLVIFNILTLFLFPVFIPTVSFSNMAMPLIFNSVASITILIFAQHRNLMEKDRLLEVSRINEQLQVELKERERMEKELVHTSLHDPLTDLPNRVLFIDRVYNAVERGKRHKNYLFAVIFLDLDRFKVVNDSLGHNIGDQLLIECARRLKTCLRSEDTIARIGGDEFVILVEDVQDSTDAIRVAERIQHNLLLPFDLEGHKIIIFMSMGIVLSGPSYNQPDDILRDADIAMYRAKGQGLGRYEIFDPVMRDRVMSRLEMETDLRKALEFQEFVIHYQPILETKNRRIVGFEALVRWQHPVKGLIPPAEFIPTAEETGLIVPIGYWVLEEACRQICSWHAQFPADPPLTMSVNFSTRQCAQPDLVQKITEILQRTKVDAGSLKLELTESLIIEDSDSISAMLSELRVLGIQVQIDDFGTGYSSLSYLHTLPIDTLKIDRSFISRIGTNDSNSEIVRTILTLAHNLGMKVVAEGVETVDQLSALQEMDCEFLQGFLFARAVDCKAAGILLGNSFADLKD
jgi:diguanylate cyclase (GGDEF)-like protein